ncbi:Bromodomain-containing protein [Auriscalpium vulgare]|uniref:Bromodomain-containing protein n=1 Tax=Auriscalpium vulgare TaxID=40419 RepID=A0ACB8SBE6_9AGAM|nr:Bromodomain-containing protein [Auriscalpium vulgare]
MPPGTRSSRRQHSTPAPQLAPDDLNNTERLLLAQAVFDLGADNWDAVANILSEHPLISRPEATFSSQSCQTIYLALFSEAGLESSETDNVPRRGRSNLRLAQKFYQARVLELRDRILAEETRFKAVVSEIDAIRSGAWDNKIKVDLGIVAAPEVADVEVAIPPVPDRQPEEAGVPIGSPMPPQEVDKVESNHSEAAMPADSQATEPPLSPPEVEVAETVAEALVTSPKAAMHETPESTFSELVEKAETPEADAAEDEKGTPADVAAEGEVASEDVEMTDEIIEIESSPEPSAHTEVEDNPSEVDVVSIKSTSVELVEPVDVGESLEVLQPVEVVESSEAVQPVEEEEEEEQEEERTEEQEEEEEKIEEDHEENQVEEPVQEEVEELAEEEVEQRKSGRKRKASETADVEYEREKKRQRDDTPADEEDPGPSRRRSTRPAHEVPQTSKKFQSVIIMLHSQISQHRNGNIFHNPIKNSEAPDYRDIVKRPIDLKTIKMRIKDGGIANSAEFQRDVYLMFANSMMYNRPNSDIYRMAEEMMLESESQINTFRQTEGFIRGGHR